MPPPRNRPYTRRFLRVVDAESSDGSHEYKRQVHRNLGAARLCTLSTQMSYRLDEGRGRCTYHVGVEDDGCHSLLDYPSVSESARALEGIARGMNSVVLERRMIQGEVVVGGADGGGPRLAADRAGVVVVDEPPVLGGGDRASGYAAGEEEKFGDEAEEARGKSGDAGKESGKLCKEKGSYTRCELVIQRVETHLLDPSPLSLSLSGASSFGESVDGAIAATELAKLADLKVNGSNGSPSPVKEEPVSAPPDRAAVNIEETLASRNIRVAVVGDVDAGKSTLIGTLTTSLLDDGRGSSCSAIMKHRHEIESGRTSTSSSHLLGFRHSGEPVVGRDRIRSNKMKSEDEIARASFRVVTLMDLAGHEKYLKTTIHGVSSGMADYGLILVDGRGPPTRTTQHHLSLCRSCGMPVVVAFTKIDACPGRALAASKKELAKLLRGPDVGRRPFAIKTDADVAACVGKLHALAPTIDISCVTGEGLGLLGRLLFALPKRRRHRRKVNRPFEFLVEDVFPNVPGVGSVVSGFVNAGELSVGATQVYVGPTDDGAFLRTTAKSAHIARINTARITAGQSATLALSLGREARQKLRRGMVVMRDNPTSTRQFDAEICVLRGEGTTVRGSYQPYVHVLNVGQTALAREVEIVGGPGPAPGGGARGDGDGIVLRPGSRAKVRFEFTKRPEYIRQGMRMLFRDGRVRGVGIITGIPPAVAVA